ncbi:MAG: type II secretion system F family protein [Candidatus Orphnella occulta]|nr:type II secretion system F family protein [Candidatus Orphnella occulta]
MPTYIYKARDATGKLVKGSMDATNRDELTEKLNRMGYMTTRVTEAISGIKIESAFEKFKRISTEDMIIFNVQLANMINSGIPILVCLDTLDKQIENKRLRETVGEIKRNLEAGDSFSQALARHPRVFSKLFMNMVKVGEASGKLDTVLTRFAEYTERQADLNQKIKGALFYPIILLFAGIAVTLFIVTTIIPQFAEIFMKAGIRLPMPTMILYKVGTWLKHYWYVVGLVIIMACVAVRFYVRTRKGRLVFDRLTLKIPIIGSLLRKVCIARFSRTLATLVSSGVSILQSLDITREVIGNEVLGRVIGNVRGSVEKGEKIAEVLKVSEEFPADTVQMISVGEETGNLDGMLNKIADFYNMSIGYSIKKLTTVLEPLFLVIMGGMVGFIMASMLLPIFDMMKVLRH